MYPYSLNSILKENIYYFFHRILWLLLYFPSIKFRVLLLQIVGAKISEHVSILWGIKVIAPWNLSLGEYSTINSNVILDCRGGLNIGNFVMIGRSSSIHTVGHSYNDDNFMYYSGEVTINNNVIIYPNVFIGPKINLAMGTVVLPNSWVRRSTKEYDVIGGVPAITLYNKIRKNVKHYNPSSFGI